MARTLEQLKGQYRSARTMNQRRGPRHHAMHGKKEKPKYSKGTIKRLLSYIAPFKFRLMYKLDERLVLFHPLSQLFLFLFKSFIILSQFIVCSLKFLFHIIQFI